MGFDKANPAQNISITHNVRNVTAFGLYLLITSHGTEVQVVCFMIRYPGTIPELSSKSVTQKKTSPGKFSQQLRPLFISYISE